jgi:hypothetical protein
VRVCAGTTFILMRLAEAEAQGLPYILGPRPLSREEWIERYSPKQDGESR